MGLIFEWDHTKASRNIVKHKVSFEEATTIFGDPYLSAIHDPAHSFGDADRFVAIGLSHRGRLVVVVHEERVDTIRIITARTATKNEIKIYEEK